MCRIYLPYLAALMLALGLNAALSRGPVSEASVWFNQTWEWPIRWVEVFQHVVFIGNFNYFLFNTAFWSLVQEMRISLIFPLMAIFIRRQRGASQCVTVVSVLVAGVYIAWRLGGEMGDISFTPLYLGIFAIGLMLSLHLERLTGFYKQQSRLAQAAILVTSVGLLFQSRGVVNHTFKSHTLILSDPWSALGAAGCLLVAVCSDSAKDVFMTFPLRKLGEISYSLYLVHASILFALVRLLFPNWTIGGFIFYIIIELPAIKLSRQFGSKAPVN